MIALIHPKDVSGAFLAFVLVALVALTVIAWYSVRRG